MSNRKIINAAATGGIGYYPVGNPTDAYYDNVSLLLNGDVEVDSNFANVSLLLDGNTLTDKSNNKLAITNTGSVTVSSTVKKFGTGGMAFSGSNRLTTPHSTEHDFGSGDFTIECWINQASTPAVVYFICNSASSTDVGPFVLYIAAGKPGIAVSTSPPTWNINATVATAIPINTWTHVAWVRSGNKWSIYVNGVENIIAASTPLTMITTTDQLSIGAANSNQYYFSGYIDDLRITKGVARYTTNFTPPVKALPTHEILDSSVYRLPVTAVGHARIDTATKKYGTGAMAFDGTGDYLTIPASSALSLTGDFTIEGWFNVGSFTGNSNMFPMILGSGATSWTTGACGVVIGGDSSTQIASRRKIYIFTYATSGNPIVQSTTTLTTGQWYHFAFTRTSSSMALYLNGVQESTGTNSETFAFNTNNQTFVGFNGWDSPTGWQFNGYIDDLRITKGYARYTANFPPGPSASLPTIPPAISADPWWGNVSLLLDGNTTDAYDPYWQNVSLMLTGDDFIDWSNQHNAVTNNGTVTLDTTNKKFNTSAYNFSGSNYLTMPMSSIGTGNFTAECWFKPTTTNTSGAWRGIFDFRTAVGSDSGIALFQYGATLEVYGNGLKLAVTGTITTSWTHVTITRSGSSVTVYLNGNSAGTFTSSLDYTSTSISIAAGRNTSDAFVGQIADLRITKGIARTITVPTAALPSYKIQDRTQNNLTLTPYGNVQLSTDVMKNGTGSMFFDGTGDYLRTSTLVPQLQLGTGDYTAECWVYHTKAASNYETYFCGGAGGFDIRRSNAGKFEVVQPSVALVKASTASVPSNQWVHVCAVRISGTTSLYINGVLDSSAADTKNYTGTSYFAVGVTPDDPTAYPFFGYIDDLRITKGYARYTQNFTPPSQSFATQYISTGYDANYADVSLLLNGNGTNGSTTFTDLSSTPKTITAYGNAQISTAVKKYGTGAMAFDGNSDYFSVPYSTNLLLNSVNSTLEGWFYLNASPGGPGSTAPFFCQTDIINSSTSGGSNFWCFADGTYIYFGGGGQSPYLTAAVSNLPINQWFHLAVVITAGVSATVYINGVSIMSGTINAIGSNSAYSTFVGACKTGAPPGTLNSLNGYADDLRITKGYARYTTNFTPPTYQLPTDTTGTVIDPLRSSTSLLLRGNGTNGSTSFTDESPNGLTITTNGTITINTSTQKYGTGSIGTSGGGYLTIPTSPNLAFGTGDFTVEFWYYSSNVTYSNYPVIYGNSNSGAWATNSFVILSSHATIPAVRKFMLEVYNMNNSGNILTSTTTVNDNTWYHVAVTRQGSAFRLFVNGIIESTYTSSASVDSGTSSTAAICGTSDVTNRSPCNIDDLRITKGIARYTSNFTPPTYEDPIVTGTVYDYNYPQVSLLLNGDGTNGSTVFKDLSSSPKTVTVGGNAQISTSVKKYGTGAMYFDGTGDYLTVPANNGCVFGTGDFTVEGWYNIISHSSMGGTMLWNHNTAASGHPFMMVVGNKFAFGHTGSAPFAVGAITLSLNTWYHLAVSRSSGSLRLFVNGVLDVTASDTTNYSTSNPIGIFTFLPSDNNWTGAGYADDVRVTKGIARYTQNFTPPTAPLPTSYS